MWLDQQYSFLKPVRYAIGYVLVPPQKLSLAPQAVLYWLGDSTSSRETLQKQNDQLRSRNFILENKVQRLAALEVENMELRKLLSASTKVQDDVLITSVTAIDPDPYTQQIIIDKGGSDGAAG